MKIKLLCIIMVLTLAFAGFSANANALTEDLFTTVDKIAELTPEDRANLMTIVYPLLIIDDGVDLLAMMVEDHNPDSTGMIDGYISKLMQYADKEELVFVLESFKLVPENVRSEYLGAFMRREEAKLSPDGEKAISDFLEFLYNKYPSVEKIFKEDGITGGTVAKILTAVPKVNDGMPIVRADSEYIFAPYYISEDLLKSWTALCLKNDIDADTDAFVAMATSYFNRTYPESVRSKVAKLFSELGVCYLFEGKLPVYKNVVMSSADNASYPVIYAYFKDGKMLFRTENKSNDIKKETFKDIEGWYKDCITELAYMGIVAGRGNGIFCPDDNVTREEFVKMICAAINLPDIDAETPFKDVDNSAWYGKYIRTAYYYKIINGQSSDTFGTGKNISRQDAAVICSNILKNFNTDKVGEIAFHDESLIAPYAKDSVKKLTKAGVINGDDKGNFNPIAGITRGESAKIINEIIHLINGLVK